MVTAAIWDPSASYCPFDTPRQNTCADDIMGWRGSNGAMVGPAIEARCEAPEMLELVEAVLDAVARLVDRRVVWDRDFARSGRRNDRCRRPRSIGATRCCSRLCRR